MGTLEGKKKGLLSGCLALLLSLSAFRGEAAQFQVTPEGGNCALSDEGIFLNCQLQEALDIASSNGETNNLRLAPGLYPARGAAQPYIYTGSKSLEILGAGIDESILDGGGISGVLEISTECDDETRAVTLRGMTLRNGLSAKNGGGLNYQSQNCAASFTQLKFDSNVSLLNGGGAYIDNRSASGSFFNNIIVNNKAQNSGGFEMIGGFFVASNLIEGNEAVQNFGGAKSGFAFFQGNRVQRNSAGGEVGGVMLQEIVPSDLPFSFPIEFFVHNNVVTGNTAGGSIGGMNINFVRRPQLTVAYNTITGNRALTPTVQPNHAGGLFVSITNVGPISSPIGTTYKIQNNIMWGNDGVDFSLFGQRLDPSPLNQSISNNDFGNACYSAFCGASWFGLGETNLFTDPQFVDAAGGNFQLGLDSPAQDAGIFIDINHLGDLIGDIDSRRRRIGAAPDMGALEMPVVAQDLASIDFGSVDPGQSQSQNLTIANSSLQELSLEGFRLSDEEHFSIDRNAGPNPCGELPRTLPNGANCTIGVTFTPLVSGAEAVDYHATLDALTSDSFDPDQPYRGASAATQLSGQGVPEVVGACAELECAHGLCDSASGACDCSGTGYSGALCEIPVCDPSCQNGGICSAPDTCLCSTDWDGVDCSLPVCTPACANGSCSAPNQCDCESGWEGDTCSTPICEGGCGNGSCAAPGLCECQAGYKGEHCETPVCDSPCVHGTCNAPNACACEEGYAGASCAECLNDQDGDGICDPFDGDECNGVNPDDHNACTSDVCDPESGTVGHQAISCNDGRSTTIDSCDPSSGCRHQTILTYFTQEVPCIGPKQGGEWRNHGQYVAAVTLTAHQLRVQGQIKPLQAAVVVLSAAVSSCGR